MRPLTALLLAALLTGLQASAEAPLPPPRRRVEAVRVQVPPSVDGELGDEAWRHAPFTGDFLQREPEQGQPASQRTEVAFAYDAEALYVAARLYSQEPERVEAAMSRRDESGSAESFTLSLDTYGDRRTAYSFSVTAAGVRVDWYHPEDSEHSREYAYSPVWEARTRLTPWGWVAELRIPFSQLRFNRAEEQRWGLNLHRHVPRRNEDDYWVLVPRHITAWASWFGELEGLRGLVPSRRVELLPYAASDVRAGADEAPAAWAGRLGVDAKLGLGPNLTMDVTAWPDFGQVELDPAQVNLSAFEPWLAERRPFFVEGSQLFGSSAGPAWFYSRRIGAAPRLAPEADLAVQPGATPLLGAAKLTGRLSSGLSLGVLGALTGEAFGERGTQSPGALERVQVEPATGWGVVRAQQELGSSGSVVGVTLTGLRRAVPGGEEWLDQLVREAYAGGADWQLRLRGGEYVFSGWVGGSHLRGEPEALLRVQRSSAHLFQRPDARHVALEPEARTLSGWGAGAKLARQSGESWLWNVGVGALSPGLELNEVGMLGRADSVDLSAGLTWRRTEPGPWARYVDVGLNAWQGWSWDGVRRPGGVGLSTNLTWNNFASTSAWVNWVPRALSDDMTRGGPLMATGQGVQAGLAVRSPSSRTTSWEVNGSAWGYETGSQGGTVSGSLSLQPTRALRLSLEPSASLYTEAQQYVAELEGGRPETYGQRYVFGTVERRELALRMRANLFLGPDLSLEAYVEPFASSGVYSALGELERAGGRALRYYGQQPGTHLTRLEDGGLQVVEGGQTFVLGNPDFNIRSLRSSVVLRWEWQPGSTLHVVWQQERGLGGAQGSALAPGSLMQGLWAPGRHTFALKLTWWLPVG